MTCDYCEKGGGIFDLHCDGCKDRIVMSEPCKILRERMAKDIELKWGFLPNYQREPNCGCTKVCIRKSRIKNKDEQPIDHSRTKAPGRR